MLQAERVDSIDFYDGGKVKCWHWTMCHRCKTEYDFKFGEIYKSYIRLGMCPRCKTQLYAYYYHDFAPAGIIKSVEEIIL